ncbi:MAG: DUF2231 domain-containing protein [Nitrospira sp.]|nr:MAG: DUF2231 domain-containing protein [Nitrospira sp. CG24D]TKB85550.1 MAG: DUF2231 domain-containing protein [Nitrospira sp.]
MDFPLHPILVHFPIALLFVSVFFDLLGTSLSRESFREGALWLLGLGLTGGIAAAIAGRMAEDAAEKAGIAEALIETHETWAHITLVIMAVLLLSRLLLRNRFSTRTFAAYLAVATVGLLTLIATGHTGGDLVYKHGAGVTTAPHASQPIAPSLHGG